MNATVLAARPGATTNDVDYQSHLFRSGVLAGVAAAVLTTAAAVTARQAGVSMELAHQTAPIPVLGFTQLTFVATLLGTGIGAVVRRCSIRPAAAFTGIAIALTAASLVLPAAMGADTATKLVLAATHVLAAAIVIPVVARRLPRER